MNIFTIFFTLFPIVFFGLLAFLIVFMINKVSETKKKSDQYLADIHKIAENSGKTVDNSSIPPLFDR